MKKILQAIGIATAVASFFAVVAGVLYAFASMRFYLDTLRIHDAASIGIIGGADGPASILVSDQPALSVFITAVLNCIVTVTLLILRLQKRMRSNKK